MKHFLLLLAFLPIFVLANNNYPIKEVNNKRYYEYTVQAGDGLFAIARKFNLKQADLHEANPYLQDGLKAGQVILIPILEEESNTTGVKHIVEPKQTLFAISRIYGVSIDQLLALNPDAANGIKVGDVLVIKSETDTTKQQAASNSNDVTISHDVPTQQDNQQSGKLHVVKKKETLYSISKMYQIPIHDIIAANPQVEKGLKTGQELRIPISEEMPLKATSPEVTPNATTQVPIIDTIPAATYHDDALQSDVINVSVLLPFMTENKNVDGTADRFVEFYKGVLLALESLKTDGQHIVVHTFDVGRHINGVDSVLSLPQFATTNLIIGPAYTIQVPSVSQYARNNRVMAIVPFTSKIAPEDANPYIYQFNPSHDMLFPIIGDDLLKRNFRNYVIVNVPGANNKGAVFANNFEQLLKANNTSYAQFTVGVDSLDALTTIVGSKPTLVIYGSSELDQVIPMMDYIKNQGINNASHWGYEEWKHLLHRYPNTYYYSLFHAIPTEEYVQNYERWFGKLRKVEVPRYDMLGYDLTYYFMKGMQNNNGSWLFFAPTASYNFMQSTPAYMQVNNALWMNLNYYLFHFDGYETKIVNLP